MVKKKRYIWTHPVSGITYVRKIINGRMVYLGSIKAQEGTEAFDREYWKILSGQAAEAKRSWGALIADLKQTEFWAKKSSRYRKDLEPVFEYLNDRIGTQDIKRLTIVDAYNAMDANSHRVRFANYIPTALSMLSKRAIRKGWRTDNPFRGLERLAVPEERKKPHVPWTNWAVEKIRAEGKELPLLIFEIGVGSVQRPGDWVGFQWGDYDGAHLQLCQNKTKIDLKLPCTPQLKAALDRHKAGLGFEPHPTRHILTRPDGSAMDYDAMSRIMLRERKRLGLTEYDQHALRYRGVMELAWAGCSDDEIASYSGHTSKEMIIKYAGLSRQITRATSAAEKRRLWAQL